MDFMDDSPGEPAAKRHKKHKKHKHKKDDKQEIELVSPKTLVKQQEQGLVSPKTSIKLKLKIGTENMGTTNVMSIIQEASSSITPSGKTQKKGVSDGDEDDDISDEEKWLDALEKGNLNSYGEIGKRDPALLTARQKALLHGSQQDELLQLPSGYKTVELTDEQKKRRQEKARRRRQQASEKIENDKNQTVHKLLKKQDSKNKRAAKARGGKRSNTPRITYRNSLDRITIHLPPDLPFPLPAQVARAYPEAHLCGVEGCTNLRTSVCSKTSVPICSLQCYKKNLATLSVSDQINCTT